MLHLLAAAMLGLLLAGAASIRTTASTALQQGDIAHATMSRGDVTIHMRRRHCMPTSSIASITRGVQLSLELDSCTRSACGVHPRGVVLEDATLCTSFELRRRLQPTPSVGRPLLCLSCAVDAADHVGLQPLCVALL